MSFFTTGINILSGIFSSLLHIPSDITHVVSNADKIIQGLGQSLSSGFGNVFSNIANAIVAFATFIEHGMENMFSGIAGAIQSFANYFIKAVHTFYNYLVDAYNDLRNVLTTVWNFIIQHIQSLYTSLNQFFTPFTYAWNNVVNFFKSLISMFQTFTATLAYPFEILQQFPNVLQQLQVLPELPGNLVLREATKLAQAMPRVLGYNVAVRTLFDGMKGILSSANSMPHKLLGAISLPFISALAGLLTESIMNAVYPDSATTTKHQYSVTPTSPTPPSTPLLPSMQEIEQQLQNIFSTIPPGIPPSGVSNTYRHGTIYAYYIKDVMVIGQFTNVGGFTLNVNVQALADTLGISVQLVQTLLTIASYNIADSETISAIASSLLQAVTPTETVTISANATVESAPLPPQFTICTPPPQLLYYYTESTTDTLDVIYTVCIPPTNLEIDNIIENLVLGTPTPDVDDIANVNLVLGTPTPTEQETATVTLVLGVLSANQTFSESLTWSVSLSV